jgi:uncharacterized damage-inducible protein DinB
MRLCLAGPVATTADVLADAFDRIQQVVHGVLDGVTPQALHDRLDGSTNSIAWLVWHLTRIQDDHLADAFGAEQAWTAEGWHDRFRLPFPPADHGYGHSSEQVAQVRVESAELLQGYHDAVHERTVRYLRGVSDDEFDRVVDENWQPPVTLGIRLVSVVSDDLQHAGQAALLRGVLNRGT